MARYINDCRNKDGYNVTFLKSPEDCCAWVIATKDIICGEELFVDYGRLYWLSIKAQVLSIAAIKRRRAALRPLDSR